MLKKVPSISLIYLMFNEEENIGPALDEGLEYCKRDHEDWEIIVVDDGSTDGGARVVRTYADNEPRIRLVQRGVNGGMGAAMTTGLLHAEKEYFCYMPADLQVDAAELRKMVPLLAGGDIVLSIYARRPASAFRAVMSRVFRDYLMLAARIQFQLEGLYLFPTKLGRELLPMVQGDTFFFSFQLIQLAVERGFSTVQTTIVGKPRLRGTSKVANPRRIMKVSREVLDYRKRRGF